MTSFLLDRRAIGSSIVNCDRSASKMGNPWCVWNICLSCCTASTKVAASLPARLCRPTKAWPRPRRFARRQSATPLQPGQRGKFLETLRSQLGRQQVVFEGIDPSSNVAQVLLAADHHMKLIGIGLEPQKARGLRISCVSEERFSKAFNACPALFYQYLSRWTLCRCKRGLSTGARVSP